MAIFYLHKMTSFMIIVGVLIVEYSRYLSRLFTTQYFLFDVNDRLVLLGKNDFEPDSCLRKHFIQPR